MKKARKLALEAALAAATAAFVITPASAVELKAQRILTQSGGTVLRRRARAGPFGATKGAKIRIGLWRPAETGTQALAVKVRVFDAISGDVLETVEKPLQAGKGHLVSVTPLSDKKTIAFQADLAPTLQTSTECDPKLTYRVSFDVVDGNGRAHEERQIWPCVRGGLIRE